MTALVPRALAGQDRIAVEVARLLVTTMGGRYSVELGIDVDRGDDEVERWFVAATLFGTRISARVAGRTFLVLDRAGITPIGRARQIPWDDLVALLDEGGYARYDFRTATRLQGLSEVLNRDFGGHVAAIGRRFPEYTQLREALDSLPGWGPVTVGLFLRELRGVWPGAQGPLDDRAARAARHLGLCPVHGDGAALDTVTRCARRTGLDVRDLEAGLVRLSLAHHDPIDRCPGGRDCTVLTRQRAAPPR